MSFLSTASVIQEYVTIRRDFDPRDLAPFIRRANRKYLKPFVGDLYTELEDPVGLSSIKQQARELFEEALCNFSFYSGSSSLILQVSGAGIHTVTDGNHTKSTNFERLDWKRELIRTGHEALDALLTLIDQNLSEFSSYTETLQKANKALLVPDTDTFSKHYYIHESRQTFLALIPTIKLVEDQYISTWLCEEYIAFAKANTPTTTNAVKVKELLQKAVVAFTVAKTVSQGQFILDGKGIHLRFDRLPHETTSTNINLKINDLLIRTAQEKETAGYEYLKQAENLIKTFPLEFTQCDGKVITTVEENTEIGVNEAILSKNKRIVAI